MVGQSYRERVDEALRSGGSETALDLAVAALETSCGDLLTEWGEAVECLGGQSAALRACLLGALPDRYRRAPLGSASALGLLHLQCGPESRPDHGCSGGRAARGSRRDR